jgi:phosphatidylinositol alpha-1,6-mannosyltransferase
VGDEFFQSHEPRVGDTFRLLSVARLDNDRKNIDGVIRALSALKERHDFRYTVIGDGAHRPALEALVRETGLEGRVRLRGRVPFEELLETYRTADLFVLAPHTTEEDIEGFGIVYLEANASGVPVLASRGNGAASAVAEDVSGFFVDDPSPEGCRLALERFFEGGVRFEAKTVTDHARRFLWPSVVRRFTDAMEIDTP